MANQQDQGGNRQPQRQPQQGQGQQGQDKGAKTQPGKSGQMGQNNRKPSR
jgi:hypothetical protein